MDELDAGRSENRGDEGDDDDDDDDEEDLIRCYGVGGSDAEELLGYAGDGLDDDEPDDELDAMDDAAIQSDLGVCSILERHAPSTHLPCRLTHVSQLPVVSAHQGCKACRD